MCLLSKLPPVVSDAYPCCPYRHRLCGRGGSVCCHRRTADCSQGGQSVLHSARHRTWNRNAWQHRIHDDQHLHSCEAEECRCWIHPAIKTDDYGSARKSFYCGADGSAHLCQSLSYDSPVQSSLWPDPAPVSDSV